MISPIRLRGGGGRVFRDPLSIFAITFRAFDRTLRNLVTFPKILYEIGEIKFFSKLATMIRLFENNQREVMVKSTKTGQKFT